MLNTDPNHIHTYDQYGNMTCCTLEEKIYSDAGASSLLHKNDAHSHDHSHSQTNTKNLSVFLPAVISLVLLLLGLAMDYGLHPRWFSGWWRIVWYVAAYIPVGFPVVKEAFSGILKGKIFSEFFLMCIATIGAFAIKQYPEGVAVMLFYSVGEIFQSLAVKKAKSNIKSLIDQRPDVVTVLQNNQPVMQNASEVSVGSLVELKPGEKVPLDGILASENASFNTAALTGESVPQEMAKDNMVYAGMINLHKVALIKTTQKYEDSKLSKILELVQNASAQKAPTELFIRKFAKIYTPIVVLLATLIVLVPYIFYILNVHLFNDLFSTYYFHDWLYRALIFLVISCPCALVVSIPLGYFGGIGAASRNGILFKGSNFLDVMAGVKNVVMDKTGTLTQGVFKVQSLHIDDSFDKDTLLDMVNTLESHSTHPAASAIHSYLGHVNRQLNINNVEEIPGQGMYAQIDGKPLLVGNTKLLKKFSVRFPAEIEDVDSTLIAIAFDKKYAGYILIADRTKEDAADAIAQLKSMHIHTTILSGDSDSVTKNVANELKVDEAFGGLFPEEKLAKIKQIKDSGGMVAFVGDGVNDAPALALSDAGIAMGGLGSDAAIETADIVIQDDKPSKIPVAIKIGKATKSIVWQNITLAFVVKALVLLLGAGGLATMWEAVFADVGVALLAILNAVRIQKMRF